MARLKNVSTGVIVEVADEKIDRLGSEWAAHDESEAKPKRATRAKQGE